MLVHVSSSAEAFAMRVVVQTLRCLIWVMANCASLGPARLCRSRSVNAMHLDDLSAKWEISEAWLLPEAMIQLSSVSLCRCRRPAARTKAFIRKPVSWLACSG